MDLPLNQQNIDHEDLHTGGLYTEDELESWKKHLELGDIHDAITKKISYGVCAEQGNCDSSPGTPQSNL